MKKYLGLLLILICSVAVFSSCEKAESHEVDIRVERITDLDSGFPGNYFQCNYEVERTGETGIIGFNFVDGEGISDRTSLDVRSGDVLNLNFIRETGNDLPEQKINFKLKVDENPYIINEFIFNEGIVQFDTLLVIP